ncbi:MAG TPA: LppP/LprE family lipoprotein [Solirubrobacteraceae bacterium]|nr:LppP/LprE family lipoprotein [Solirubrobacteraceae bacterium]
MKRTATRAISTAALCACAAALLAACGSSTKTVTASSAPPATQTAAATTAKTTSTATTPAQTTSTSTAGTTPSATTRAAPEPAFTQHEAKAEGVSAAAAIVRERGFTPNATSDYHANQALRVLVGTRTGSGDGYGQQAFFFVNGRYIGTDAKQPSATVKVVGQSDTEVTLGYPLYRKSDPLSSPSGGEARVTFQLNNGKLVPLGKIPPAESTSGLSRQ